MNVGFVGLGTMGTPMVMNLLKHGFPVKVYSAHLSSQNVKLVVGGGAVVASSSRAVAQDSEVVMMSLPRAEVSESVVLGSRGILSGSAPGTIIVETSTVPPSTVMKIARAAKRKQVEVLDAPVSGGRPGAELGTLTLMVGGNVVPFERCRGVFNAIGTNIYHVGGLGAGETIKIINSLIAEANLVVAREGLELASRAKIDLNLLQKIIAVSTGQSWTWNNLVPKLLDSKAVGVPFDMLLKDLSYALTLADEVGVDPNMSREVSAALTGWREIQGGSADISSVFTFDRKATKGRT